MSILHFTNGKLYVGEYDLSGNLNQIDLSLGARMLDATTFGADTEIHKAGLKRVGVSCRGFWDRDGSTKPDDALFANLAVADKIASVWAVGATEGDVGFALKTVQAGYKPRAPIGELLAFEAQLAATGSLIHATMLAPSAARTTSSNSAGQTLGLVGAGQSLYAFLHVLAVTGTNPTLDVTIKSDDNADWLSPTTRITFTQATARGAQWATPVAGPIATDTRWRAYWTIGGTDTPTFTFLVGIAIG